MGVDRKDPTGCTLMSGVAGMSPSAEDVPSVRVAWTRVLGVLGLGFTVGGVGF